MDYRFKLYPIVMGAMLSGCVATFEPRLSSYDLSKSQLPTAKETRAGLEISVEEFASPNNSRRAFDADISSRGVLALLVRVENKGTKIYKVQKNQIRAFSDGQPLPSIYGYEAANQGAARDPTWNALVNTAAIGPLAMYFWPATMALSAQQAKVVNRKIEYHFESLELIDRLVKPDETAAGFVYFRLSEKPTRLENLTVEITVEADTNEGQSPRQLRYNFSLPTLELPPS